MRLRWYLYSLVLSFAVFGIIQQYHIQEPNQELVLQFNASSSDTLTIETSIDAIQEQLIGLGAASLQVTTNSDGFYKITYYSNTTASSIKTALELETSKTSRLEAKLQIDFQVFEIQSKAKKHWDFEGQLVSVSNPKSDRLSEVKFLKYFGIIQNEANNRLLHASISNNNTYPFISTAHSVILHGIRAGPNHTPLYTI